MAVLAVSGAAVAAGSAPWRATTLRRPSATFRATALNISNVDEPQPISTTRRGALVGR